MESLAEAAQYVRGYGMRLLYVIQNKAQLRAKYGANSAEDIFDNTGAEIAFGTNDLKLTKELSERMGDCTINVTTKIARGSCPGSIHPSNLKLSTRIAGRR